MSHFSLFYRIVIYDIRKYYRNSCEWLSYTCLD